MADRTETDLDPKLALKVATDEHIGQVYELTRTLHRRLQSVFTPAIEPMALTPWADLDERQRRTFIRDTQDGFADITSAVAVIGYPADKLPRSGQ